MVGKWGVALPAYCAESLFLLSALQRAAACAAASQIRIKPSWLKLLCLLGFQGDVLRPWKLVSCVSLASAVPLSQGMPLKSFQLLAAPSEVSCWEPAVPSLSSMAGSSRYCFGSSGISSSFGTPPGVLLWLGVCAWRQDWLRISSQIPAACSMERCQCFKGDELWPLNVLCVAVRMEVP